MHALPLAYIARADVFLALEEHNYAVDDLKEAVEFKLPKIMRVEVQNKLQVCQRALQQASKKLIKPPVQQLDILTSKVGESESSTSPDAKTVNEATLFDIEESPISGRYAVAAKQVLPGALLLEEEPIAACLLPDFYGTHCQHCFLRLRAPIGCPVCSSVAYCGKKCRDIALSTYHRFECKIMALLIGSGMSILSTTALRMVTKNGLERCIEIYKQLDSENISKELIKTDNETKILSKSSKRRMRKKKLEESQYSDDVKMFTSKDNDNKDSKAYNLVTHASMRSSKDFFERTLMASFLLQCLRKVQFFKNSSSQQNSLTPDEIRVGALLLRNLQLLQFNAHEIFETRLGMDHRFRNSKPVYIGVAIYPTASLFNHDCYPAVTRFFKGRNIVMKATRTLNPGDIIAENYGPIFTKRSLSERQRSLSGRYWFQCTCTACKENWPTFDTLSNNDAKIRCPTRGCNNLYSYSKALNTRIKCSCCRKHVNLEVCIKTIKECESEYTLGLDAMEKERPQEAITIFSKALEKFHEVAVPPHRDTHLAEIAFASCMADSGNVWKPISI